MSDLLAEERVASTVAAAASALEDAGVAYVLMVQRSNFPNSDASEVRGAFQQAAAKALAKP